MGNNQHCSDRLWLFCRCCFGLSFHQQRFKWFVVSTVKNNFLDDASFRVYLKTLSQFLIYNARTPDSPTWRQGSRFVRHVLFSFNLASHKCYQQDLEERAGMKVMDGRNAWRLDAPFKAKKILAVHIGDSSEAAHGSFPCLPSVILYVFISASLQTRSDGKDWGKARRASSVCILDPWHLLRYCTPCFELYLVRQQQETNK